MSYDVEQGRVHKDARLADAWLITESESGQAMISFALMITAMMAVLALVIDIGMVLLGPRRFDQNAADAAALAAGRLLADAVSPVSIGNPPTTRLYFSLSDSYLYRKVRQYAGISPDLSQAVPTETNQNPALGQRTKLAVTLEYSVNGTDWCRSDAGPAPIRLGIRGVGEVASCPPTNVGGVLYPPLPDPGRLFRLRVTVSSTTNGFFTGVLGVNNEPPPPPGDDATAACIRPHVRLGLTWTPLDASQAPGRVTCAQAVVTLSGSAAPIPADVPPRPLLPVTAADCGTSPVAPPGAQMAELLGSPAKDCNGRVLSTFMNLLDLSSESTWCNVSPYHYLFGLDHFPDGAGQSQPGSVCYRGTPDPSWQRSGYSRDPGRPGGLGSSSDAPYWIANGFGGAVYPDSAGRTDGNHFPTYAAIEPPAAGVLAADIWQAFYGPAGTYFFAPNQPGFHATCPDEIGELYYPDVGCRDARVITWAQPQSVQGSGWVDGLDLLTNTPWRVRAARILNIRLYCVHQGPGNYCIGRPGSNITGVLGSDRSSSVYGRFLSRFVRCTDVSLCRRDGVSVNGNYVTVER